MSKFLPLALLIVVASMFGCSPSVPPQEPFKLTKAELDDLESQAGVPLNAGDYLSAAEEETLLSPTERERLADLKTSAQLLDSRAVLVNRTAITARVVTFSMPDGTTIKFVGAPILYLPRLEGIPERRAWTGRAQDRSGLMIDDVPGHDLVIEVWHLGQAYTMSAGRDSRFMIVSRVSPTAFYEPPDMSGHPRFPDGVR